MSTLIQRSFAAGEISPAVQAHTDNVKFQTGLKTCRNMMVLRHGGVANRPGSKFIAEVKDSTKRVRLIPFIFNSTQTYVLEFGNQYMRVHRDGVQQTLTAQAIGALGITNANPGVLNYVGADNYVAGDHVYISGVVGPMANYVNGRTLRVGTVTAASNIFNLLNLDGTNFNTTALGAYTSGGTIAEVYELATSYLEADLDELQFIQSADVITIVHPSYPPAELSRSGHTSWALANITFAPGVAAPTGATNNGAAGTDYSWVITAIDPNTGEESLASSPSNGTSTIPAPGAVVTITWTAVSGVSEYNVYRINNSVYGLVGVAGTGLSFNDGGIIPDMTTTPPVARNPFSSSSNYPSAVAYIQQRLTFGNSVNDPENVWMSRSANYKNFTTSSPTQDDDAVTFTMVGRQVNSVRHLLDIGKFVVLTSGGEWTIEGNESGIIVPGEINPKQQSYYGSSSLSPIVIGGTALFVQARGSTVRDLGFEQQADGYRGNDLTTFSSHLVDGYEITDWTYQQIPHSIVWMVRDDGTLLGLTYVREQQILGWHRHDTNGTYENVCAVPEGSEDALYVVVKRTINGAIKRYVERLETRMVDDIADYVGMDSALSYDGWNAASTTMTLSGGSTWLYDETLTCTASASTFVSTDVGNEIHLIGADDELIRFTIEAYSSATVVTGKANRTVPTSLRTTATTAWARAVDDISGLWHLEGKEVSILGDGFVVGSPNNPANTTYTVTSGVLTLDRPYAVIHIGLPFISDLESLNIDTAQTETLADKQKRVGKVTVHVEKSRGIWAGAEPPSDDDDDPLEGLNELKIRDGESLDEPIELATGTVDINIQPQWNSNGRSFIRQIDPLPLTILALAPDGLFPFRGGR